MTSTCSSCGELRVAIEFLRDHQAEAQDCLFALRTGNLRRQRAVEALRRRLEI